MKTTDLNRDQVDKLLAEVTPMLGYRSRLSDRMDKRGMGTAPLAASVRKARNAMQEPRWPFAICIATGVASEPIGRSEWSDVGKSPAPLAGFESGDKKNQSVGMSRL